MAPGFGRAVTFLSPKFTFQECCQSKALRYPDPKDKASANLLNARTQELEAKAELKKVTKSAQDDENELLRLRSQVKVAKAEIRKHSIDLANKENELEQMKEQIADLDKKIPRNERKIIEATEKYENCHKQFEICEADRLLVEKVLKTPKNKRPMYTAPGSEPSPEDVCAILGIKDVEEMDGLTNTFVYGAFSLCRILGFEIIGNPHDGPHILRDRIMRKAFPQYYQENREESLSPNSRKQNYVHQITTLAKASGKAQEENRLAQGYEDIERTYGPTDTLSAGRKRPREDDEGDDDDEGSIESWNAIYDVLSPKQRAFLEKKTPKFKRVCKRRSPLNHPAATQHAEVGALVDEGTKTPQNDPNSPIES